MSDLRIVVSEENYEALEEGPLQSSPSWLSEAIARLGWTQVTARTALLQVTFADTGMPSAIPVTDGGEAAEQLPPLTSTNIAVDKITFSRGDLMLNVEVAAVSEHWAREWANANLQTGIPGPVPLGQGFASTSAALIDTGALLMRASWWSETTTVPDALANGVPNPMEQFLALDSSPA